jgi:hypothetical protein
VKKSDTRKSPVAVVQGECVCGRVHIEFDFPAFWAWHDHSRASRHAHGAAYATYVGCWKSRVRITQGADLITRYKTMGAARSFCTRCGTPLMYERSHSPQWVNIPRALFAQRTGREARYHIAIGEAPEWAYKYEPLVPLKGYPGVMWHRPRSRKRAAAAEMFDALWPKEPSAGTEA